MDPVRLTSEVGDQLTDLVYTGKGTVYCLSVHVLRLPERRRWKPANADEAGFSSEPEFSVLHPPSPPSPPSPPQYEYDEEDSPEDQEPLVIMGLLSYEYYQVPPESQGPHLNPPATIKPLLPLFDPATVFAPPYDTISAFTGVDKNLVFCRDNLYHVWRNNTSCTVTLQLPAGGQRRVTENEILVLRYHPRRQPCWDAVKDLGGYSFFVGKNNAVSMCAEGVPGLRGNCVYWIGGHGRDEGMVFDMESGRSTPCEAPQAGALPGGHPYSTICWYFMSDVMSMNNSYNSSSSSG